MLFRIETLTTVFLTVIILLSGCAGCAQKNALKGIEPTKDYNEQSKYGPVAANTREPAQLEPFPEPSFENLIEQFKADVAAKRGDPEVLARKKQVIKNPDMLWMPYFMVPNYAFASHEFEESNEPNDVRILSHKEKGNPIIIASRDGTKSKFKGKVYYLTKEQQERQIAIARDETLSADEKNRRHYDIMFEGIDALTAAKYLMSKGQGYADTFGVEYAERAMQEHPDSLEAMRVWAHCVPQYQRIAAYKKLLSKFPNAADVHQLIALNYFYHTNPPEPELALYHTQRAIQLDSRIAERTSVIGKSLLGKCYVKLGEWEKAIALYQGLSGIEMFDSGHLEKAKKEYAKLHAEGSTER